MCRKKKCKCHKKEKPKPIKVRCVVEKPKKLKKEPIDQLFFIPDRRLRDPPPSFTSLLDRSKK